MASGSGAVGKAVVSDTRDPCFESGHRQLYLLLNVSNKLHRKDEKIKRGQNGQFFMQKVKALSTIEPSQAVEAIFVIFLVRRLGHMLHWPQNHLLQILLKVWEAWG